MCIVVAIVFKLRAKNFLAKTFYAGGYCAKTQVNRENGSIEVNIEHVYTY